MTIVQSIIMGMFDIIEYIIISKKIMKDRNISKLKIYIGIVIYSIIIGLIGYFIDGEYSFFINAIVIFIMLYLFYKRTFIENVYIYLMDTIIIVICQLLSILMSGFFIEGFEYSFIYGILSQIITLIIVVLIYFHVPINVIYKYAIDENKTFKTIIINLFVIIVFILVYWEVDFNSFMLNGIVIACISICLIYINFILLKNGLLNEQKEKEIQIYKRNYQIIDDLMDELRCKQHEYDNHIMALEMMIVSEETYEKGKVLIEKYINGLNKENYLGDLVKLDNKILAGFLYNMKKESLRKNIKFEIKLIDYAMKTKLKDFEMIEVISNLINNAFETQIQNNRVKITFKKENNMNIIEVVNKHPYLNNEMINRMFKKNYSTKSGGRRGLGLYNLKTLVEKYDGTIEVYNKKYGGNFVVFRVLIE